MFAFLAQTKIKCFESTGMETNFIHLDGSLLRELSADRLDQVKILRMQLKLTISTMPASGIFRHCTRSFIKDLTSVCFSLEFCQKLSNLRFDFPSSFSVQFHSSNKASTSRFPCLNNRLLACWRTHFSAHSRGETHRVQMLNIQIIPKSTSTVCSAQTIEKEFKS